MKIRLRDVLIQRDTISGMFLLFIGLFIIIESFGMNIWKNEDPREGFFPLFLAIILCGLSIFLLIKTLKSSIAKGVHGIGVNDEKINHINEMRSEIIKRSKDSDASDEKLNLRRLYEYLAASLSYVILFEKIGYILTTTLFILVIIKFVEKKSYLFSLLTTLAVVSISFLLFDILLGVPLPLGILESLRR